jgi:4-amino-4-deoxy-L-arabinose transferase-like glycosyltransferase
VAVSAPGRLLLLVILLAHFGLALQYSLRTPLGEAPDEADHWAYTVYLATERQLPVGPALTQAKHPPLYFAGAALFAGMGEPDAGFFRPNPAVNLTPGPAYSPNFFQHGALLSPPWSGGPLSFHLARLFSVLLGTVTVAATAALARAAFPASTALAVAAAGMAGFVPQFLFIGGAVNNDNGAAMLGALSLWGSLAIYRGRGALRAGWWTGVTLGLGVLVKMSSLALWPVAGLGLLLGLLAPPRPAGWRPLLRDLLFKGVLMAAPAWLLVAPLLWRNLRLYGDPFGMSMAMQTIDARTTPWTLGDTAWLLEGWFISFWGKFGGAGHIPMAGWIYWLLGALCVAAVGGLMLMLWRGRQVPWSVAAPLAILASSLLAVAAVMWLYSLRALGTDQGRLLFPAYAAILVLLASGLLAWAPERRRLHAAVALTLLLAVVATYALWGVIVPIFAGT